MGFDTVILTPYKVMAVSCIMTVYTKILTPSGGELNHFQQAGYPA